MDNINNIFSRIISEKILTPDVPCIFINNIEPGHDFGPHDHEWVEVISILSGSCYFEINDEHIKLRKDECLVIFPNVCHRHYQENNQKCRIMDVCFTTGDISTFHSITDLEDSLSFFYELKTHTMSYLRLVDNRFIRLISECIYNELKNESKLKEVALKLHFCELYVYLSNIIDNTCNIFKRPLNKHVKYTLEYISKYYIEKITIDQIAEHVRISRRQLSRLFVEELNMTIQDYLAVFRIEKAKELLKNSNLNITQIAQTLGYSTSEYFAACFKKYLAISPKKYRQINK